MGFASADLFKWFDIHCRNPCLQQQTFTCYLEISVWEVRMMNYVVWLWVAIGGAAGSLLRHGISILIPAQHGFPWATLSVNLMGCFFLPFVTEGKWIPPDMQKLFGTGLIGSFTTFSTFSVESMELWGDGNMDGFWVYTGASLIGGIMLSALSFWIIHRYERTFSKGGK